MTLVGLRRNIDYEEAMQLVDSKGDFVLGGLEYPAMKIVRNPLFQRMAEGIETTHTQQTMGRMQEEQRVQNIQHISVETGVTRQDLEAIIGQMASAQASQQPDVDMGPPSRDTAQEASNCATTTQWKVFPRNPNLSASVNPAVWSVRNPCRRSRSGPAPRPR